MIYIEALRRLSQLVNERAGSEEEARQQKKILWEDFAPVRFGSDVEWTIADTYILAAQRVPSERTLIVFRTECYVTNLDETSSEFLKHLATPPGTAWWAYAVQFDTIPTSALTDQTDRTNQAHLILDTDNLLIFKSNVTAMLLGTLLASPGTDITRNIRTTCYGFYVPAEAYERLRNSFEFPNFAGV